MNMKKAQFFILTLSLFFPAISHASNVSSSQNYAWGDVLGWVNFSPTNGNVIVSSSSVTGYAWSANYGWINLSPTNGGVLNDGNGNLSGKAWGSETGWIDFTGVSINSSGQFVGHTVANSIAGTITFSCTNCDVVTTWTPPATGGRGQTTPPASSGGGGGSIALGGYSQVPYAQGVGTSSAQNTIVSTASPSLNRTTLQPIRNAQQIPQSASVGQTTQPNVTNIPQTSGGSVASIATTSKQGSASVYPTSSPASDYLHAISSAPLPVKTIAIASILLLVAIIIARLLILF